MTPALPASQPHALSMSATPASIPMGEHSCLRHTYTYGNPQNLNRSKLRTVLIKTEGGETSDIIEDICSEILFSLFRAMNCAIPVRAMNRVLA